MGKVYKGIDRRLREFVLSQPLFFVATAPGGDDGHVNVSPKGMRGCFAVLDEHRVAYLDYTGSGIETIAHLRDNGRITVMFCSFNVTPKIIRLYGRGEAVLPEDPRFAQLRAHFPETLPDHSVRSVIDIQVNRVSDSCGFAVPMMTELGDRPMLTDWAGRKSEHDLVAYRKEHNTLSIDGLPGLP